MNDTYVFDAEQRHNLRLPLTPAEGGFRANDPALAQFNQVLSGLAASDTRPFGQIQGRKVVTPTGVPSTVAVLDVFDRPLYALANESCELVQLQAPVLKGVKASEFEAVSPFLELYVPDLSFEMAPQRTLAAYQVVTFGEFIAQAGPLVAGFCNRVREAAAYVRDHRAGVLQDPTPPELAF